MPASCSIGGGGSTASSAKPASTAAIPASPSPGRSTGASPSERWRRKCRELLLEDWTSKKVFRIRIVCGVSSKWLYAAEDAGGLRDLRSSPPAGPSPGNPSVALKSSHGCPCQARAARVGKQTMWLWVAGCLCTTGRAN
eukprot:2775815-Alexandrium_andersonii.AAC.1